MCCEVVRSRNCKLVGRCVLFLVHEGGSVCFASPAVIHSSSFLHNENDIMRSCVKLVPLTHIENDKSHKHSCGCCLHRNSDLSFATRELHGEILTLIHTKLTDCIKITKQYNNQLKSFPAKKGIVAIYGVDLRKRNCLVQVLCAL